MSFDLQVGKGAEKIEEQGFQFQITFNLPVAVQGLSYLRPRTFLKLKNKLVSKLVITNS